MSGVVIGTISLLSPLTAGVLARLVGSVVLGFVLLRWWFGPPAAVARRWSLLLVRGLLVGLTAVILLNPCEVDETPGPIERPDMFYLLDSSQSMAIGDGETRFEHAVRLMREAEQLTLARTHAEVKLFRFGHRLSAIDDVTTLVRQRLATPMRWNREAGEGLSSALPAFVHAGVAAGKPGLDNPADSKQLGVGPTDSDTQLLTALRQASSRFGRQPPAGIVLFSDGRARDEAGLEATARQFARLGVPVHVVPLGDIGKGGDVAIVAVVAPPHARRYSEVEMQVFLRSYGYDGRRCEVTLTEPGGGAEGGQERPLCPPMPVTLRDGFQSASLSFRTDTKTRRLRVQVSAMPSEVSTTNNSLATEVTLDRTKIRVLYVEGSAQPLQPVQKGTRYEMRGPFTDLQQSLMEDEDIECRVLVAPYGRGRLRRIAETGVDEGRGFPETVAELAAFDAIILSDVGADSFTEQQLEWIEQWIGQRGGGLLMVGGQQSFTAGGWDETPLREMLPITMSEQSDWLPGTQVAIRAAPAALAHPLWSLVGDEAGNREIVGQFPSFLGANRWQGVKPNLARVLAYSDLTAAPDAASPPSSPTFLQRLQRSEVGGQGQPPAKHADGESPEPGSAQANEPAIVVGQFGRGRTMAMSVPITSPWANDFLTRWGSGEVRYSAKFWRNAVYWLTESSSTGRRRLVVEADKKFYRPGETISISATAFDEAANQTGSYRIAGLIEPRTDLSDISSDYSPIRWPDGMTRESGEAGPFVAWGEEFNLPRIESAGGTPSYALTLPVADALSVGSASQSLRVELTAMEEFTQVDSTSLEIQVLHDPFEQQNPFPNHELLESIARLTGGKVVRDARGVADILLDVPIKVGAPVVTRTPIWSNWWLWCLLLGIVTTEWIVRRVVGLA